MLTALLTALVLHAAPHDFAPAPGDLLAQCEGEGIVLDVRAIDGQTVANLNYKESPAAHENVGSVVPVERTANGVKQTGKSYAKKGSYCAEPTLPVRKFSLELSGSAGLVTMTLGYETAPLKIPLSCWGILASGPGPAR